MIHDETARWLGPATPAEVAELEAEIGPLAAEYREFLLEHGCGLLGSTEVFGLGKVKGARPDLRWLMSRLRGRGFQIPAGLVPISEVGDGSYAAVRPDGQIVYWDPSRTGAGEQTEAGKGFWEWLRS